MKAAVLVAQNEPLAVAEVEIPELGVGQVLVKVAFSGICGKQMEEINGKRGPDPYIPHLLGHEGAGEVVDVGLGVRKVKSGDHVVMHWMKGSGIDSLPPRFQWDDKTVSAGWVTTFSKYTVVSENRVTPIPKDVPLDVAALLGCAVTTGLGIVFKNAAVMPGESIAVFGAGGIGLNVLQGAVLVSAHPIVAVDLFDHKLEWASKMGATHLVNGNQPDLPSHLMELLGGKGFDVTVDTTGNRQVREIAYNATSDEGRTILAGVPQLQDTLSIDSFPLHHGRRIIGSHGGDTSPDEDIPRYLKLYQLGKLNLEDQITHRFALDDVNEAVAKVQQGDVGRCLITL
ncbi:zinc-binding dehydrogenase [SAR202 cluster bacterium AD-802-F09_MRT_200m]|nr:zinc-binding dehydrogenase [SAR202 cluster bacterium AD-802-F09_MRT_200m]